jgi:ribonuclease VapC
MTFVDAAAIVAILAAESEADRCAAAITAASDPFTSPIAVWEAVISLARPDKFGRIDRAQTAVHRLLDDCGIELRQMPPPAEAASISTEAARLYRSGRRRLNLADCFHYACARHYGAAILSTDDEFRFTDLETVP